MQSTGDSILARHDCQNTDYIQKCDICMSLQSNQTKEQLICHEPTSRPWEKVATDIFTLDDKNYLCTVDYYSGYFEVDQLHSKTGTVIVKKLKRHFVTHETPNELLSGNERPSNSAEFENFTSGTEHVTSSPGYPQSNGWVENAVKTAKRLIKKAKASGADYFLSLLSWRNMPTEGMSTSPALQMFGWRTRTHLELSPLVKGETVRVMPLPLDKSQTWLKAEI